MCSWEKKVTPKSAKMLPETMCLMQWCLLCRFLSLSSILGMHLFGCKFSLKTDTGDTVPDRKNFDSLLWAIVTVFQVRSGTADEFYSLPSRRMLLLFKKLHSQHHRVNWTNLPWKRFVSVLPNESTGLRLALSGQMPLSQNPPLCRSRFLAKAKAWEGIEIERHFHIITLVQITDFLSSVLIKLKSRKKILVAQKHFDPKQNILLHSGVF